MIFWWVFSFIVLGFFVYIGYYAVKFNNPYKLFMVFGRKGCGKTTYLTKLSFRYLKKGWTVYTTDYIPGTIHFEPEGFGKLDFVNNSVVLMDEVGIIFDNRNFKNFKPATRDYFKYQRHCKVRVYLFSQTFDVDVKIRDLTDKMFFLINYFNVFTVCKRISTKIVPTSAQQTGESKIVQQLYIDPFFLAPFGARDYIWIPHWAKYFDSHEVRILDLDPAPTAVIGLPDGVYFPWDKKNLRRSRRRRVKSLVAAGVRRLTKKWR